MHTSPAHDPSGPPAGDGATPARPAGTLTLRAPAHRVHRRAILWWTLQAALGWVVIIGGQVAWLELADPPPGWLPLTLTVSGVLAVLHLGVMPAWRYLVHRWEATPEAVCTRSGWLNQEWRIAPIARIQTIDTKRRPLEQLLGLATVTITTASAAGPLEIVGLATDDAAALVEELTATTQATEGDAT
ncbi:MAG TPA: PH domain-containing protein [Pseudonocardiaceae bacterium]|jgi:hypothetical protein|nr:PH domain-containing protein [Pseudonocardiaceae bacterium]